MKTTAGSGTEFHKMHGAGNDFVLIDARQQDADINPDFARRVANRHLGVGCDQLLVIRTPRSESAHARYEIWNADGSPAGQCGNGARCIGLYLAHSDRLVGAFRLESPGGIITLQPCDDGEWELGMGEPSFDPEQIPVHLVPRDGVYSLPFADCIDNNIRFGCVSMGNPHALVKVDSIEDDSIPAMAECIASNPSFPEGVNVGFAEIVSRSHVRLRVIERGAGETLACGSGACAAVAVLRSWGLADERVEVSLPGGTLVIKWRQPGQELTMKGPAQNVFKGTLNE